MHLQDLFAGLFHGEFGSIQLAAVHQREIFAVDGVIKSGICPLKRQVFSVTELPGSLIRCDFRFRTD